MNAVSNENALTAKKTHNRIKLNQTQFAQPKTVLVDNIFELIWNEMHRTKTGSGDLLKHFIADITCVQIDNENVWLQVA